MTQDPKKLHVYQKAFELSVEVYKRFKDVKVSLRLREQLFGSVSSICANLAEMGSFESKTQQKQKIVICIGECNEAEYWFDFCKEVGLLNESEHQKFLSELTRVRIMLFNLFASVKKDIKEKST